MHVPCCVISTFRTLNPFAVALASLRLMQTPGHRAGVVLPISSHILPSPTPSLHPGTKPFFPEELSLPPIPAANHLQKTSQRQSLSPPAHIHPQTHTCSYLSHCTRGANAGLKKKQASSAADGGLIQNRAGQMIPPPSPFLSHSSPISEQQRGGEGGEKWPIFQLVR